MKFTCKQPALAQGVAIVNHAVSPRSTLPILANILLAIGEDHRLKLSATNLEIGISCFVDASIDEEGSTTVPAKLFSDHIASLAQMDEIELSVLEDTNTMLVRGQRARASSRATIEGMAPEEFPLLPTADESRPPIEFDAGRLKEVIEQVAFAAADDDSRPVLTAVLVRLTRQKVVFAAADSFRLAVREIQMPDWEVPDEDFLIPARTLQELARILPSTGMVQMTLSPNRSQVLFHTPQVDLVSRLVEGTYPNIAGIIPKEAKSRVVVNRKEWMGALKAAIPFARDSSNITRFKITLGTEEAPIGQMTIEAMAEDIGSNVSVIDAAVDGEGLEKIIFNCKYLSDVLAVLDCEHIALELTTGARPGVIKPVGDLADQFLYVLMPMSSNR